MITAQQQKEKNIIGHINKGWWLEAENEGHQLLQRKRVEDMLSEFVEFPMNWGYAALLLVLYAKESKHSRAGRN